MYIPEPIIDLRNLKFKNRKRIWKPFMQKYDCQTIAELGVRDGENFDLMIEHSPKLAVAIDAWRNDGIPSHNDLDFTQEELDIQYKNFTAKILDKPFVKIYREYTFYAVKHFPDNFFDLIYIDADHTYDACLNDIKEWYPKVKKGRFLVGDDYLHGIIYKTDVRFGVIEAVKKFTQDNNLVFYELPHFGWTIIRS